MPTITIKLREPWWGAGKKFNWMEEYQDMVGFGVDPQKTKGHDEIVFETKWGNYKIEKEKAKTIAYKYKSFYKAKGGVMLAVVPREACEKIN